MRKLIAFASLAAAIAAVLAIAAAANPRGSNGRIAFGRDGLVYTANPDGTHEQQLLPTEAEAAHWSPDSTQIAVVPDDQVPAVVARIVNPDTGTYRDLPNPDPAHFVGPNSGLFCSV